MSHMSKEIMFLSIPLQINKLTRVTCAANMKTSCLRLMRATISNELAVQYSWYGAKKKKVFVQLETCKVIMSK